MFLTPLIVSAFFLVLLAISLWKKRRQWQCLQDIPQPPGYPIIGNLFDVTVSPEQLFKEEFARDLKYYPIFKMTVLGQTAVDLLSPEDIELVLTDMKQNSKGFTYKLLHGWLGTGLLTSTGSKWQKRRKILTPSFHFNILQEFITIFAKETDRLVKDLKSECHQPFIDVVVPITQFTLLSIGETAMGIDLNNYKSDQKGYKDAIYEMGRFLTYRLGRPWLFNNVIYGFTENGRTEKKVIKTLHNFSNNVINDRKKELSSGSSTFSGSYAARKRLAMLDLLLRCKSEGADIDDEGIREEVDTFMFEGHDTTSMGICYSLMLLANERKAQDEIYKEIQDVIGDETPNYSNLHELKYMERCIKEILRLYPSVPIISRTSGSEIKTKSGYTIPADCMVNIKIYGLHHNPYVFSDPEKFDPDRFLPENANKRHPFAYIPFSAGPRNCIGQKFAMLEIKTALCGVLKEFVLEPVDTPEDMVFITDMVLRPKGSIKVKFVPRHP